EQYQRLYEILISSNISNIWLAIGNHDVEVFYEAIQYWKQYIGPEYYYIEDIPGWRIVILNSETRLSLHWRKQLDETLSNITNRSAILVFHRPAFPDVDHNLDSERRSILMNAIKNYDHVKLVLQGHWHGWAKLIKDNITWIITGGAGAPLYSHPEQVISKDLEIITRKYHYTITILYPNQTFKIIPVLLNPEPSISITKLNETAYKITNNAHDIYWNKTKLPIRLKHSTDVNNIYIQLLVEPGSTIVNVVDNGYQYILSANTSDWYVYLYNKTNPDYSKVFLPENNCIIITYREKPTSTTTTTTAVTETSATTTPKTSISTTTTTETTTTSQTTVQTSEIPIGTVALGIIGILLIVVIIMLMKKK
ncbi:MAG: hypothetical protein J7L82_02945, partial [Staphylothermus sp.]|nr:hypothetical protein [Staphylothermus sp.]